MRDVVANRTGFCRLTEVCELVPTDWWEGSASRNIPSPRPHMLTAATAAAAATSAVARSSAGRVGWLDLNGLHRRASVAPAPFPGLTELTGRIAEDSRPNPEACAAVARHHVSSQWHPRPHARGTGRCLRPSANCRSKDWNGRPSSSMLRHITPRGRAMQRIRLDDQLSWDGATWHGMRHGTEKQNDTQTHGRTDGQRDGFRSRHWLIDRTRPLDDFGSDLSLSGVDSKQRIQSGGGGKSVCLAAGVNQSHCYSAEAEIRTDGQTEWKNNCKISTNTHSWQGDQSDENIALIALRNNITWRSLASSFCI